MAKRIAALLLCLVLLGAMLPRTVQAAGFIDTDAPVCLTVSAKHGDAALQGAKFSIYLVGTFDKYGELTVTEDFQRFNLDIRGKNEEAWNQMIPVLEGWVNSNQLPAADEGTTDENGQLRFPTGDKPLTQGMYLVVGQTHTQDGMIYMPSAFLITLPSRSAEDDSWVYDVTVAPKFEAHPEKTETISRKVLKVWKDEGYENIRPKQITVYLFEDGSIYDTVVLSAENGWSHTWEGLDPNARWTIAENAMKDYAVEIDREGITFVITNRYADAPPPTTKPGGGKLPQTGQLWWPVPVLFALGLAMIVLGMARRRGNEYEE